MGERGTGVPPLLVRLATAGLGSSGQEGGRYLTEAVSKTTAWGFAVFCCKASLFLMKPGTLLATGEMWV